MTKREALRQTTQENTLLELGFTRAEAESLRRISMRLQHWYERECGTGNGCIERDEATDKPYWLNSLSGRRFPIRDDERGAERRLKAIVEARNARVTAEQAVCPNCDQWQHAGNHGDCLHECVKRGFAPARTLSAYLQGDPRGAALYIIRPGDVPAGQDVSSYYTRGICVY